MSSSQYLYTVGTPTITAFCALLASENNVRQRQHYITNLGTSLKRYRTSLYSSGIGSQNPNTIDNVINEILKNIISATNLHAFQAQTLPHSNGDYNIEEASIEIFQIMKDFLPPKLNHTVSQQSSQYFSYQRLVQFICMLHHLPQISLGLHLPIIVWRSNCRVRLAKEFRYHCSICSKNEPTISLTKADILNVRHGTTGTDLVDMLQLQSESIKLKGHRRTPPQMLKDICPQGLLYFDVDLENRNVDNFHAFQNRYGAATVKFNMNDTNKLWSYFKLGTKKYSKGYSQHLLATERKSNEWWLLDEPNSKLHSIKKLSLEEFSWNLHYCTNSCRNGFWTHPEIVVDGDMELSLVNVRIRFQVDHKCINLPDGRRFNCIECDIRESFGLCYAKVGGIWKVEALNFSNSEELSIQMFALSTPLKARRRIKKLQRSFPQLFDEGQFNKIVGYWNSMNSSFVENWITSTYTDIIRNLSLPLMYMKLRYS